jgi:hypothetical protein
MRMQLPTLLSKYGSSVWKTICLISSREDSGVMRFELRSFAVNIIELPAPSVTNFGIIFSII